MLEPPTVPEACLFSIFRSPKQGSIGSMNPVISLTKPTGAVWSTFMFLPEDVKLRREASELHSGGAKKHHPLAGLFVSKHSVSQVCHPFHTWLVCWGWVQTIAHGWLDRSTTGAVDRSRPGHKGLRNASVFLFAIQVFSGASRQAPVKQWALSNS